MERPVKLSPEHDASKFDCGAEELDRWIKKYAYVNQQSGNASVYVALDDQRILGYYALAMAGAEKKSVPPKLLKGGAPSQIPCLLLARLAVDREWQEKGLGRGLLVDAIQRAIRVSTQVGVKALLIHARDDAARDFYHHLGGFQESPTDSYQLFLSLKEARKFV